MNKIDHNQLHELLLDIDKIARKAGKKILEIYETDFSIANKEDNSPPVSYTHLTLPTNREV